MKRPLVVALAALLALCAVPALASQGDSVSVEVPGWAWSLLAAGLVAGGGMLARLVVWSIQRELRPLQELVGRVAQVEREQVRIAERVDALRAGARA